MSDLKQPLLGGHLGGSNDETDPVLDEPPHPPHPPHPLHPDLDIKYTRRQVARGASVTFSVLLSLINLYVNCIDYLAWFAVPTHGFANVGIIILNVLGLLFLIIFCFIKVCDGKLKITLLNKQKKLATEKAKVTESSDMRDAIDGEPNQEVAKAVIQGLQKEVDAAQAEVDRALIKIDICLRSKVPEQIRAYPWKRMVNVPFIGGRDITGVIVHGNLFATLLKAMLTWSSSTVPAAAVPAAAVPAAAVPAAAVPATAATGTTAGVTTTGTATTGTATAGAHGVQLAHILTTLKASATAISVWCTTAIASIKAFLAITITIGTGSISIATVGSFAVPLIMVMAWWWRTENRKSGDGAEESASAATDMSGIDGVSGAEDTTMLGGDDTYPLDKLVGDETNLDNALDTVLNESYNALSSDDKVPIRQMLNLLLIRYTDTTASSFKLNSESEEHQQLIFNRISESSWANGSVTQCLRGSPAAILFDAWSGKLTKLLASRKYLLKQLSKLSKLSKLSNPLFRKKGGYNKTYKKEKYSNNKKKNRHKTYKKKKKHNKTKRKHNKTKRKNNKTKRKHNKTKKET